MIGGGEKFVIVTSSARSTVRPVKRQAMSTIIPPTRHQLSVLRCVETTPIARKTL